MRYSHECFNGSLLTPVGLILITGSLFVLAWRRKSETSDSSTFRINASNATNKQRSPSASRGEKNDTRPKNPLVSVNFHFLRQCNYKCKFCFHTDNHSPVPGLADAKAALQLLHQCGTAKINFSGGEPFLKAEMLGQMCRYAKEQLGMTVSIISNGSLVTERWMDRFGNYVDMLGVSCDSFDPETNARIGRAAPRKDHLAQLRRLRGWCAARGILFKLNTVVCAFNCAEDMTTELAELCPARWKVFQCMAIAGENDGTNPTDRDVTPLLVSDEAFEAFIERHKALRPVVESNEAMRNSYILLDERMRFLNNQDGKKTPSASILEVGVKAALQDAGFDHSMFLRRGGLYDWAKPPTAP